MKALITADDFGFTSNINRAIIDAYEKERVTELSLMVDSHGTKEAVSYIRDNTVEDVGLHFSLNRLSVNGKTLQGNDYDQLLNEWTTDTLQKAFDDEVSLFEDLVGFSPRHIIGHKQIDLHPKLYDYVAGYTRKNNCYVRGYVAHETLKSGGTTKESFRGRTVDSILAFRYGPPEKMYEAYTTDIQKFYSDPKIKAIEILFHPGYPEEFEKSFTSFIQERIDDIQFLLSDKFLQLVSGQKLELVPSSGI